MTQVMQTESGIVLDEAEAELGDISGPDGFYWWILLQTSVNYYYYYYPPLLFELSGPDWSAILDYLNVPPDLSGARCEPRSTVKNRSLTGVTEGHLGQPRSRLLSASFFTIWLALWKWQFAQQGVSQRSGGWRVCAVYCCALCNSRLHDERDAGECWHLVLCCWRPSVGNFN